jgi:tRNA(fMet)-specific endonuclease VapC
MTMDICLDTNVFRDADNKRFFQWIRHRRIKAYVPAVSYQELSYHEIRKFGSTAKLDAWLNAEDIVVTPFTQDQARTASIAARQRGDFKENARDYAIGALAVENKMLMITNNKKHFNWIKDVYTPAEIMEKYP